MTHLETKKILNAALEVIGSRGLSGVTVSARSLLEALETLEVFPPDMIKNDRKAIAINLRRQELIEVTKVDDTYTLQPSVKGIHRLQRAHIRSLKIDTPQQWDGVWRMVSYDIPARYTKQRRLFTAELHRLGFVLLKDSTWFHPYPSFDVLARLVSYCGLSNFVMIAEIVRLDDGSRKKLLQAYPSLQ